MRTNLNATLILVGVLSATCIQTTQGEPTLPLNLSKLPVGFDGMTADDIEFEKSLPPYQANATKLVDLLIHGDEPGVFKLMHPVLSEKWSPAMLKNLLHQNLIPYFKDFQKSGREHYVTRAVMPGQKRGYTFYESFMDKSGNLKPYVIYMIEDHGTPRCASILLNKTYRDMHQTFHP
ncbi:MAG: hypothetical protein JST89_12935 [Cyanobacteria bacterium SZAS-4]|nr:hypothetical protein [Cyanobacteria bacterium SZAS-4]